MGLKKLFQSPTPVPSRPNDNDHAVEAEIAAMPEDLLNIDDLLDFAEETLCDVASLWNQSDSEQKRRLQGVCGSVQWTACGGRHEPPGRQADTARRLADSRGWWPSAPRQSVYAACSGMRSSSAPSACSACHTSNACCIPSHSAGPLPAHFPSRTAISGVTGALPARIRCRSCRDTPSSRAACETFIRNAGSTSSRRISPGWVGSRFNGCRTGSAFVVFRLRRRHRRHLPFSDTAREPARGRPCRPSGT